MQMGWLKVQVMLYVLNIMIRMLRLAIYCSPTQTGPGPQVQVIECALNIIIRKIYFLLTQTGPGPKVQVVKCVLNIRISNILLTYVDGTWASGPGHRNVLNIRIRNTYLGKNPGTTLDIKISNCWMVISKYPVHLRRWDLGLRSRSQNLC